MKTHQLAKFWPLMHSVIQEIWTITEPHIEEVALRKNIPVELYYYGELGLEHFSIEEFQQRDPFSDPEKFERLFPRLEIRGWIFPLREAGRYEVTEQARDGVRLIVEAGDNQLAKFEAMKGVDLDRLLQLLKPIILASNTAPEPPKKWAILNRFRVANGNSPLIVQVRESLMDLFAYRDDSHLSAARPHFNRAGIVWSVLGSVWSRQAVTAEKMAETMSFRGYDVHDYDAALQAAVQVGWLEEAGGVGTFRPTQKGQELHEQVEELTDEYFYCPWKILPQAELDELYDLLAKLREQLHAFKKSS